jgi:diguanylate cyclase (GGDEF)-like protein
VVLPLAALAYSYRRYTEAVHVRAELARLSLHDSLTGLPNRLCLREWIDEALRESARGNNRIAVLFVDLDRFKVINDTYGHETGDQLMMDVAERLRSVVRPGDRILRYGGDEFVMVCRDVHHTAGAERVAAHLVQTLEEPFELGQDRVRISCSVGIAIAEERCDDPDDLVRDADTAMYAAKGRAAGSWAVFDRSMNERLTRASAESRLRAAIERGEFLLHYQPVVSVPDGRIVGVEALLRWQDPERGLVPPDEFIPALEETGLIVPVGQWVLEEACRQAHAWNRNHPEREPLEVAVNVSARQLAHTDFREVVSRAVNGAGVPPRQICLEITEGVLLHDVISAWATLRQAKSLGVRLALDDFGTGYSSLSYIRRFALDVLKVDRSFVDGVASNPVDAAIVEHVVAMAHALGMATVAEGVEDREQLAALRRMGCDVAQGVLFSKAVPPEAIDDLLRKEAVAAGAAPAVPSPPTAPATPSPSAAPQPPLGRNVFTRLQEFTGDPTASR